MPLRIKKFVLDEPSSKNAFSPKVAERFASEVLSPKSKNFDALLFVAKGEFFCSGGNLSEYAKMRTAAEGKSANRKIAAVLDKLATLPVPTACVVQGDCLGGGVELISAFDFVVSAPEVQFGFWQRRIGLSFGWGGKKRLAKRLSFSDIEKHAMESKNISAFDALNIGLIDQITLSSKLEETAVQWLKQACSLPALPIKEMKSGRHKNEQKLFEKLWWNAEHLKVLRKFKR